MRSLLYAVLIGLMGAVILHIVVILTIPIYSGIDAYARVFSLGADGNFRRLPERAKEGGLSVSGPFIKEAVCAFSTSSGPILLTSEDHVPFWSTAVFDTASNEIFSMNDRTAINGQLGLILGTEAQIAELKKSASGEIENAILVTLPGPEGYAVLRAFSPEKSTDPEVASFLNAASCDSFTAE